MSDDTEDGMPEWLRAAISRKRGNGAGRKVGSRSKLKDNEVVDNSLRDKALKKLCYRVKVGDVITERELDAAVSELAAEAGVVAKTLRKDLRQQYPAWIASGEDGKPRRFGLALARECLVGPPDGWYPPKSPSVSPWDGKREQSAAYAEWLEEIARWKLISEGK